jgi:hypothetical protein
MPSLQTLPLELRQRIYTYTINPPETTKISAYTRRLPPKCVPEEIASSVLEDGKAHPTPKNDTALLRVSREVSADARPILYGCYKFSFQDCRALELFLDQIRDMKQYLRHVAIATGGYEHDHGPLYGATKRSFAMLASATGLQSFSISHFELCCAAYSPQPNVNFEAFVDACAQLLQAILNGRNAKGLKVSQSSHLNIVKIVLPACSGCAACSTGGRQMPARRTLKVGQGVSKVRRRCRCQCLEAEHNNEVLLEQFKRSVAIKLHLE